MSIIATKEHCKYCFDYLLAALNKKQLPKWPSTLTDASSPLFVTWKIKGNLRGCIGTFSADLHSTLLP
jgi:AMMECR1 domain-containing protein